MKVILMAIQSIPLSRVANVNEHYSTKIRELRTTVPKDFKGWVYFYCTKAEPYLYSVLSGCVYIIKNGITVEIIEKYSYFTKYKIRFNVVKKREVLNGKVVCRFWFDESTEVPYDNFTGDAYCINEDELKKLCLSYKEVMAYGKGKDLYSWHIKNLEIFDEPMQLSDFYVVSLDEYKQYIPIKKAPQSWQYVEVLE